MTDHTVHLPSDQEISNRIIERAVVNVQAAVNERRSCLTCGAPARIVNGQPIHVDPMGRLVQKRHTAKVGK